MVCFTRSPMLIQFILLLLNLYSNPFIYPSILVVNSNQPAYTCFSTEANTVTIILIFSSYQQNTAVPSKTGLTSITDHNCRQPVTTVGDIDVNGNSNSCNQIAAAITYNNDVGNCDGDGDYNGSCNLQHSMMISTKTNNV